MSMASDQQLIMNYLAGDEKSLEILIRSYLKPIYNFIYRYVGNGQEAEDITQEVFVRAWRNLRKFDQNKKFKTWIFSIAKNASIDFLRKKKTIPFSEFVENIPDNRPLPTVNFLEKTLEKLSPQYRMILFLRYNDHFTFREIAEALREPLNTIKSRHRRAIVLLKKLLTES